MKKVFELAKKLWAWLGKAQGFLRKIEKALKTASIATKHFSQFWDEADSIWRDESDKNETVAETVEDIVTEVEDVTESIKELIPKKDESISDK